MSEEGIIAFDDFLKVKLKAGKVLEAENVEKSEKLLKFQVDLGEKQVQILAGIAKWHDPDNLVGKNVMIVENLAPRKIMGEESEGMLLSAHVKEDDSYKLIILEDDMPAGSEVH